jgi:hypothetical protein
VTSATAAGAASTHDDLPFSPAPIEELLRQFGKGLRAHQLYLQNNPVYQRTIEQLRAAFPSVWESADALPLRVTETELVWHGVPVLVEPEKASDSLPWLFYKDGVREIEFLRGFEHEELVSFLDLVQRVRRSNAEDDDLLTLLWEREFTHLRYKYVDVGPDGASMDEYVSNRKPLAVVEPHITFEDAPS